VSNGYKNILGVKCE